MCSFGLCVCVSHSFIVWSFDGIWFLLCILPIVPVLSTYDIWFKDVSTCTFYSSVTKLKTNVVEVYIFYLFLFFLGRANIFKSFMSKNIFLTILNQYTVRRHHGFMQYVLGSVLIFVFLFICLWSKSILSFYTIII